MLDILLNMLTFLGVLVVAALIIAVVFVLVAVIVGTIGYIRKEGRDNEKQKRP